MDEERPESCMSRFYCILCECMVKLYIMTLNALGYSIGEHKHVESLIVTEESVQVLNLSKTVDSDNVSKYLRHHIMYTDDKFHEMDFFDGPLVVRFKYQNETYQICLKQLKSKNNEHTVVVRQPKYLSAVIKVGDSEESITEKIVEFHGPSQNFFSHILDAVSDIEVILKDHKGTLYTFDMLGRQHEIQL